MFILKVFITNLYNAMGWKGFGESGFWGKVRGDKEFYLQERENIYLIIS